MEISAKNKQVIKLLRSMHLEKFTQNVGDGPQEVDDQVIDILTTPHAPLYVQTGAIFSLIERYHPIFNDDSYWAVVIEALLVQQHDGTVDPLNTIEDAMSRATEKGTSPDRAIRRAVYPAVLTGMLRAREWC